MLSIVISQAVLTDNMASAMEAVKSGMSITGSAKMYGVSLTTLYRRVKNIKYYKKK